jgi:hypothetical protein
VLGYKGRAAISMNDAEILAFAAYSTAFRCLAEATRNQQRAVNESRSAYSLHAAYARTEAARLALSQALEGMHALMGDE